ncbi:MAG: thioredoxin [Hadesarchaea archaeon]|nr:thioredoxin [Hadesarchaea archaeon]
MDWDEELRRIRERKLEELMRRQGSGGEEKKVLEKPIELNAASFRELIKTRPFLVVDCWAPWCTPCRLIAPVVEELAQKYAGRITFGKLNVDENPSIASELQIMSIPTLLVFKQGRLVDRIVGAMPRGALEARITRWL